MKTSSLTRGSPVSKGEGERSQSAYCLHNLCEIPLHKCVPKCFPRRRSTWVFGCDLKSFKTIPVVQNSCTYQTVAVSNQGYQINAPFLTGTIHMGTRITFNSKSCFQRMITLQLPVLMTLVFTFPITSLVLFFPFIFIFENIFSISLIPISLTDSSRFYKHGNLS